MSPPLEQTYAWLLLGVIFLKIFSSIFKKNSEEKRKDFLHSNKERLQKTLITPLTHTIAEPSSLPIEPIKKGVQRKKKKRIVRLVSGVKSPRTIILLSEILRKKNRIPRLFD